ncbi:hypothetical protein B0H21DRAFT_737414 [Amylocystis lapponica]|nr:hypothetical protein B0H21DRAFT_737414 [Amylocystis lapponica]
MSSIALARAYQQSFQSHRMIQPPSTRDAYQSKGYDIPRTLRFFAFGFGTGPLIGRWNFFLERHFPLRLQGGTTGKVSIPALSKRLAVFIGSMGLLEGRDGQHIRKKYVDMYPPALKANWEVWPVAQVPHQLPFHALPYRVPFQSSCGVFWTLYLSILNSKEDQQQDRTDAIRKTLQ